MHQQTAEQVVVINEIQMARSQYAGQSLVGVFLGAMHTQWTNSAPAVPSLALQRGRRIFGL
ncbi:MAG: hypothetical protein A3K19_28445 [Lentisphaerae bacterium RIFOXYB12_FULL_65_16]|nr:MAG: hypothetical protein A3K18_19695 [Lentisphaerae bacterium RIFOXYA12_64_32]OGV85516.1 MAG: hypothetical protein A3K19_28445 [Lentisphaerae bacterium RIFOXYB12_FULL_65_16]